MSGLPDNWVSGYDGQRWFFQYVPTGMVQYHFPQDGDEYAEFLLDVGTGPIKLTPEDSLAIEQETKRRSIASPYHDTKSGPKTSVGEKEKGGNVTIKEEYGMSATGYFDSSAYFPDIYNNVSPVGDDDTEDAASSKKASKGTRNMAPGTDAQGTPPISNSGSILNPQPVAAELPESSQQTWSPVGFVAELATQDTIKCAEELAPVELDATSHTPAPIQTIIAEGVAELPTHRTPVENKTLILKPTQPVVQPVDSYPLVSASFAYPPLKVNMSSANDVSSGAISIGRKPVSSGMNPADVGQNKFQPWKPTQGIAEQQFQEQNKASAALPQTSILQNQDSELGSLGRKNAKNQGSSTLSDIPNTLAPPVEPRKPTSVESSSVIDVEASSIPAVLHPAHRPGEEPSSLETPNQQVVHEGQAKHDDMPIQVASHNQSYAPSVLKPGSSKPDNSLQESILPHRPSEPVIQTPSTPTDQPGITKVNTMPNHLPSANSKMNGSPGFLFFHEIPSKTNPVNHGTTAYTEDPPKSNVPPQTYDSSRINLQSHISVNEQIPVVAPLNFVKLHSSKVSEVSSITPETPSGKLSPASSDEISEVISVISSFAPQETPAPNPGPSQQQNQPSPTVVEGKNKPNPMLMSQGMGRPTNVAASGRPQPINQQLPSPPITMQQSNTSSPPHGQITSVAVNVFNPISVTATPINQANVTTSPGNIGITTGQSRPNAQATYHPSPPIQGPSTQNQHSSPSLPSQAGNPGKISTPPGPLKPQGNTSTPMPPQTSAANAPSRPPSQASHFTHTIPVQLGAQSNSIHHTNNPAQQTQASMLASHVNGPTQIPVVTSAQQVLHHPLGQNNASPHSIVESPTFGHPQSAIQNPQLQHSVMARPSGQQSAIRPPVGNQVVGPNTAQNSVQPPYQHSSPVTQSVSPIQSQVSSPAQSIASLHVSQSSTPSSTFATMNTHTSPNVNANQTNIAPIRPSSVPAHALSQQVGNLSPPINLHPKPSSPAGIVPAQSSLTSNPPAKPYPMLPGQVTPLPSQVGSGPSSPPTQQSIPNNYAKPAANTQQSTIGQQPMQNTPGGPIQNQVLPGQMNPMLSAPQGSVTYGPALSQAQMKPPQQQTPLTHSGATHTGGYQFSANQPQPQHPVSYPSPITTAQPHSMHTTLPPSTGSLPAVSQHTFAPPPVAQIQQLPQSPGLPSPATTAQGKPFTSAQAAAVVTDVGKGMKKWAKKVWKNPAIKQTAVGIGGAVMAESMGVNGAAGAHLANSLFTSATRPPLSHAQTAPAQAHGIPGVVPQHQVVQMGQQHQPGKPQPLHPQPNHHPGYPQPGHPQPGHPQPGYPQHGHPQLGHPQPGHPQPAHPQSVQQPVGVQMPGRPPIAQNPSLVAGGAVNFNAQAQAQFGFNQQQQYPLVRPVMVNIPPPPPMPPPPAMINIGAPSTQAQAQANADAANLATAAGIVNSIVGAAIHHNNSQQQHGHAQPDHTSHSESYGGGNHGHGAENHGVAHEQAYGSSVPPQAPATYTDNSYAATDATYTDNSSYSVNNAYVDNTEVVNNTVYIDNSTTVVADMTYNTTGYADTATFSGTDVTSNMALDINVNSTVYTDSSATGFSMDESIAVTSSNDFAVESTDYSGSGWGDIEF
ncbi:hypothetical protein F4859DRAFT_11139 [Xylaria cf. heliscus]|nr:hypothetical protein F4859DRAFT_11139 [Xylaria cf. heliscus]